MAHNPILLYSELVKTLDLHPLSLGEGDSIQFRIEIHKQVDGQFPFTARIWRIESYRLQPTFPQQGQGPAHPPCDERVILRDDSFPEELFAESADGAVQAALAVISQRFSLDHQEREGS